MLICYNYYRYRPLKGLRCIMHPLLVLKNEGSMGSTGTQNGLYLKHKLMLRPNLMLMDSMRI